MENVVILLVEDDVALLEGMSDTLEMMGYRTVKAINGREGLEKLKNLRPDLIISDIMMPEMDGYTFRQEVSSRPETAGIPFIFLTAKSDRADVRRGLRVGVDAYLTKPFDLEDLLLHVQNRLSRFATIRREAMSQLEELQQQIVTMFSHELRTPLTYIQGYTDLLAESPEQVQAGEAELFLEGIQIGSRRLNMVVDKLLTLVHLDTNVYSQEFDRHSILEKNFGRYVELTATTFASEARKQGLGLEVEIEEALPPVRIVPDHILKILANLVDNAIKFTLDKEKSILLKVYQKNDRVCVDIVDHGIGIKPNDIPHIFERFRQINRARLEQPGLGVGLTIARSMARINKGDIDLISAPGKGSTFTFWLPVALDLFE